MTILERLSTKVKSKYYKFYLSKMKKCHIPGRLTICKFSDIYVLKGASLSIGSLYLGSYSTITAQKKISIGENVMIGENVHIYDHNHRFNQSGIPFCKQGYSFKEVSIGDNCWIGSGAIILAGSHIGNNVVIGAGCVISGNIPDNSVVKNKSQVVVEPIVER